MPGTQFSKNETQARPYIRGYRMPAEWDTHDATWLTWPQNPETWPDLMRDVEKTYVEFAALLSQHEAVHILVNTKKTEEHAADLLKEGGKSSNIFFHVIETNDAWLRDNGPIFVVRRSSSGDRGKPEESQSGLALVNWEFNSWGGKYPPWDKDNAVPAQLAEHLQLPVFNTGRVLEGGSIDVNGEGSCLTTESCLLKPTRNPGLNRAEIEMLLEDYLGIEHVIWLGKGIAGDDTDGHVDDLARFVNPTTIVAALEEDHAHPNYVPLRDNFNRLRKAVDKNGKTFDIIALPTPPAVECDHGPLPASYANFYIANKQVVMPTFGHRNDRRALKILSDLFPGRQVVGIDARGLVVGLGAFHCITQQQPACVSI